MTAPMPLTLARGLTRDYLLHHRICPKELADDGTLVIAVTDGSFLSGADEVAFAYRRPATLETVPPAELDRLVERLTTRSERSIELARAQESAEDLTTDVRDLANQPPVIRYVNLLVRDAYDIAASDI